MTDESVSSSPPVPPRNNNLITSPNNNDVLLGRGSKLNHFVGNKNFRRLVERYKREYLSVPRKKDKHKIAREIFNHIQSVGGRFLKQVDSETPVDVIIKNAVWCEVDEAVALDKCKQAARQKWLSLDGKNGEQGQNTSSLSGAGVGTAVDAPALTEGFIDGHPPPLPSHLPPFLPTMVGNTGPCDINTSHSLLQPALFALQQPATTAHPMATNSVLPLQFNCSVQNQNGSRIIPYTYLPSGSMLQGQLQDQYVSGCKSDALAAHKRHLANCALSSQLHNAMPWQPVSVSAEPSSGCTVSAARPSTTGADVSAMGSDHDLLAYLKSLLISDRPMITEEQVEMELATMTDEERVEALMDLFGKQCGISTPKGKRARRDVDMNSIDFLVKTMRLELERIPEDRKRALLEAQTRCHADEFSDSRLEQFLRCEGMDEKLGVQRFVNYWESRRKVFGPDKFVLRMSLSGALCDDLAAVEACVYRPLPRLDASGRQLLLSEPCHHTREGYTSESMLRAVWYVFEVMAEVNRDMDSGFVCLTYLKDFTMWDYDHGLYERIIYFEKNCWPIKIIATHGCFPPSIFVKIIQPIVNAMLDKRARSRILMHDVPESQLLDILSDFGIQKDMLPTKLGGTILLDQAGWMASRRAAELLEEF